MINCYHNNPLTLYFKIDKTQELVAMKYYWLTLYHNIKTYIQGCNLYLAFKTVRHNPYGDL